MIDPDYIRPFALCNKPRRVPYASPLPSRQSGTQLRQGCVGQAVPQPRLPGKPVQNMPPSPHRQGRRGYVLESNEAAPWIDMFGPAFGTAIAMLVVMTVVCVVTWGLPYSWRVLAPIGASIISAIGVFRWAKSGTVSIGRACAFATVMTLESAALPAAIVGASPDRSTWAPAFLGLLFVSMAGAMFGAIVASLLTREPCLERCHICK